MTGSPQRWLEPEIRTRGTQTDRAFYNWGSGGAPSCRFQLSGGVVRVPAERTFDRQRAKPGAVGEWPAVAARGGGLLDLARMPAPEERTAEYLYITDVPDGWCAITNDELGAGFGLCWDPSVLRHVWYWQVARGAYGYPWYGRAYSMALEPWTSWPGDGLAAAVHQGTALRLAAGETLRTRFCTVLWQGRGPVERVTPDGVAPGRETPTLGERG